MCIALVSCTYRGWSTNLRDHSCWDGNGIGHESYDRAKHHDDEADPDPWDERVDMRFDDGTSGGLVDAFVNEIEIADEKKIFAEAGVNAGQRLRLLAGLVEAAFGIHGRDLFAAPEDGEYPP